MNHRDYTRRRTSPLGVDTTASPLEVDPELTPPPQAPPAPDEFAQMDLSAQVRALHAVGTENAAAIGQVWPARHDGPRLDRMEDRVDRAVGMLERAYAQMDTFVIPQLKNVMGQTGRMWEDYSRTSIKLATFLENEWPRTVKTIEGVAKTLDDVIGRLGRVEHGQQEMTRNHGALDAQLRSVQNVQNAQDVRLTALEQRNRDEDHIAKGGELVVAKATKWASAVKGVIAAAILAGTWLASKFINT